MALIAPLGGTLIDRRVGLARAGEVIASAAYMPVLQLSPTAAADVELLADGAYSPLKGFMSENDYESVVEHATLSNGTPWTLPITLPAASTLARTLRVGDAVALRDEAGDLLGTLAVRDVFRRDLAREAAEVYRTTDVSHPGVRALMEQDEWLIGGSVTAPARCNASNVSPREARSIFEDRGWSDVVGFQTRNPIHRAHEYLTKIALEQVDGLFLHPLVGVTKDDDVPADVRMRCYDVLLQRYYPQDRVLMSPFVAAMRYAGPREAIYHGLVRRNFGCSHFIIGRDAAGVGSYYGSYDAQRLYDELGGRERLGFAAFKFEHTFFCRRCDGMASTRTCPHASEDWVTLSGSKVRELLRNGEGLPREVSRPEVAAVLRAAYGGEPFEEAS
jgi:sulfate adenylyltransferase